MGILCKKISDKRLWIAVFLVFLAMMVSSTSLKWFVLGVAAVVILDLDKKFVQLVQLFLTIVGMIRKDMG